MQQDTFNSSNRFRRVVVVFLCLLIGETSTEDTSGINSTNNEETTRFAITQDEIYSSTPEETTIPTVSEDVITSKCVSGRICSPIIQGEIGTSTVMTTETMIFDTERVELSSTKSIIMASISGNEEKFVKEEISLITSEVENSSTSETSRIATIEMEILPTMKVVKSEDLKMDRCTLIGDCMKCVTSSDLCNWSVDENMCKSPDATPAGNPISSSGVIQNENYSDEVHRKGVSFCPRIVTSKNITVPSDTHKMIKIKVSMKYLFTIGSKFTCRFGDGSGAITTPATLLMDTISCSNAQFSYPSDEPFIQLPICILYGEKELSNPKDVKLIIYKCRYMADNCISCFSFGKNYECGWCPGSETCEIAGQCEEPTIENLWIGRRGLCPQFTQ